MEAIIFTGIQASGKSTFYIERFFQTHLHISLDVVGTRRRERVFVDACLATGQRFVVDNTNPTAEDRARYIGPAKAAGFQVIGYYFDTTPQEAARRNRERTGKKRVPPQAIYGTARRLEPPTGDEGFDALYRVQIDAENRFVVEPWPTG